MVSLSACGPEAFEVTEGFFGGVAADEPRAALVARDILVDGGNAADAATAAYFVLAATLPSSAGLGATGSCLVFDAEANEFERLSFPAVPSADGPGAFAVPTGPRAIFALQARYGRLRFEQLLNEAERLARFGEPISKSLADDMKTGMGGVESDKTAMRVLADPSGRMLAQGQQLVQIDLAATLSRIRSVGVGDLYVGGLAARLVDSARSAGYAIDPARLRNALPEWTPATGIEHDNHVWSVAAPSSGESAAAEQALAAIFGDFELPGVSDRDRPAALAAALAQAVPAGSGPRIFGAEAPSVPGATAWMAVDRRGQAVGCAISLGSAFGAGKLIPGIGIFPGLLEPPVDAPAAYALVIGNRRVGQTHALAMASGGRGALSALVSVMDAHWDKALAVGPSIAVPRTHATSAGLLLREPAAAGSAPSGLSDRERAAIGRVGLFRCYNGLPKNDIACELEGDRRGSGLALIEGGDGG